MRRQVGSIRTNSLCIGCNRCIASCPVPGANLSRVRGERHHIEIDDDRCVHCGLCLTACKHQAREYADDTEAFFSALAAGRTISLAIDPSFRLWYPERLEMLLGYLRSLGVGRIYDVSFGADICTWATLRVWDEQPQAHWITSDCPTVVSVIEKFHPELFDFLLPVLSPLLCTAVYADKYLGDTADIAYIGPCIAKRDEVGENPAGRRIRYYLTYKQLFRYLENVVMDVYAAQPDLQSQGMGNLSVFHDGMKTCLSYFMENPRSICSMDDFCHYLSGDETWYFSTIRHPEAYPDMLSALGCKFGCLGSPGVYERQTLLGGLAGSLTAVRRAVRSRPDYEQTPAQRRAGFEQQFAGLRLDDFRRSFHNSYRQPFRLPEDILNRIFISMNKKDAVSRTIDCGFCGYPSCREMARAIAYGFNQVENCIHYTRQEALRLYLKDTLTGIPNWTGFERATRNLLWNHPAKKYLIAFFDIQNFKMINDLYGFEAGDRTLRRLAQSVAEFVRTMGTCGRVMNDYFVLCMPENQENIDRLIAVGRQNMEEFNKEFPVSLNFGFYSVVDTELPIAQMMDCAHLAQESIKGSYDLRWAFYDEAQHRQLRSEAWMVQEMRRALKEKQFQVFLQPQYEYASGRIVGAEALVRWVHPERGMISPGEFIPLFEKNSFISQVDAVVWEQACALLRRWLDDGLPVVPVSVNLSRIDLFDPELPAKLDGLRKKYRLPGQLLQLEITESAYTQKPRQLIEMVGRLRAQGFRVEMDDFGSGYSSLNTLHEMPVDVVKLDLRFLSGSENSKGQEIIQAVVQMMQRLHLPVIAEGVETAEQAALLAAAGCPVIQGFYYCRPISADEFESRLRAEGGK